MTQAVSTAAARPGSVKRRSVAGTVVAILSAAAIAAACSGLPSIDDLRALPAAGLSPPDSQHLSRNERAAEDTIEGPVAAILGDIMVTKLEPVAIFDFYAAELGQRGYAPDDRNLANIRTTVEVQVHVWRKGDVIARVAILRAGDPRVPRLPAAAQDASLFELAFIAKPPEDVASPS